MITLEEGKFYRTRDGQKVGPLKPGGLYEWETPEAYFTAGGVAPGLDNGFHIVAEWADPVDEACPAQTAVEGSGDVLFLAKDGMRQAPADVDSHDFGRLSGICSKCRGHASKVRGEPCVPATAAQAPADINGVLFAPFTHGDAFEGMAAPARSCSHTTVDMTGRCVRCWAFVPESLVEQGFVDPEQVLGNAPPDIKVEIADEAKNIVSGARRGAYGKPEDNFERIARYWDAYFKNTGRDISVTAADVSPLMRLVKEARLNETPDHRDSHVDLVGYALTGAEVNGVKPA